MILRSGVARRTDITVLRNKQNANKYIEIHSDGYGHYSVKQYMEWSNGVKNLLGDRRLHRWYKRDLDLLKEDYESTCKAVEDALDRICDLDADPWEVKYED